MLSAVSRDSFGINSATSIISLSRTKGQVYSGPLEAISVTNIAFIHRGPLTLGNHGDLLQQLEMNIPSPPHSTPSAQTEVLFLQGRTICLPLHPLYPGLAVSFRITSLPDTSAAKGLPCLRWPTSRQILGARQAGSLGLAGHTGTVWSWPKLSQAWVVSQLPLCPVIFSSSPVPRDLKCQPLPQHLLLENEPSWTA